MATSPGLPGADNRIGLPLGAAAPLSRFLRAAAAAAVLALLLGSEPLQAWVDKLPPSPPAEYARVVAAAWHQAMERLSLTRPYAAVRGAARAAEDERF